MYFYSRYHSPRIISLVMNPFSWINVGTWDHLLCLSTTDLTKFIAATPSRSLSLCEASFYFRLSLPHRILLWSMGTSTYCVQFSNVDLTIKFQLPPCKKIDDAMVGMYHDTSGIWLCEVGKITQSEFIFTLMEFNVQKVY